MYKGKDLYKDHLLYLLKVYKANTYNKHTNNQKQKTTIKTISTIYSLYNTMYQRYPLILYQRACVIKQMNHQKQNYKFQILLAIY